MLRLTESYYINVRGEVKEIFTWAWTFVSEACNMDNCAADI